MDGLKMAIFTSDVFVDNVVTVDGSATTQPVSAASLPLPTGASTSANQATELASLASIDSKLTGPIAVTTGGGATGTITQVSVTTASITLKAANASRKKLILTIPTVGTLYIAFAVTASATIFTYKATTNNTVIEITGYTGIVTAITASGTNIVNVTEVV